MLTDREREILSLIAEGMTNRDIAKTLVISESTVLTHYKNIRNELAVKTMAQAVYKYFRGKE